MAVSRSRGRSTDVRLLTALWQQWQDVGTAMPAGRWSHPTGLGKWTVRDLFAHVALGVRTTVQLASQPAVESGPELGDAAAYFAALRPLGEAGAAQVARLATQWASVRSDAELVAGFDVPVPDLAGDPVVRSIAGTIRFADYLVTRVLEATVHLLDVGVQPPGEALDRAADVLLDLCPPADFVRLATGRPAGPLFPVLT
ncbi:maleylpyruvate isomerase N-terminal domain-containing protein [Actinocrispum sp. NPDC049592]|uniref:maleylpyruvate isomerase N-terminal domain-containing protein n=1 Tax=Actinocrispum sp. NPDC049592 TaxID=3154835 RepID=UPI003447CAE5